MPSLTDRLASVLADVATIVAEPDGALTLTVDGSVASLRVVDIGSGLELVSLTQPLAWDLPLNAKTRERVAELAAKTMLGSVVLLPKPVDVPVNGASGGAAKRKAPAAKVADVMLRYNFPGSGLSDEALRTLVLMVLAVGADVRGELLS